MLVFFSEVPMLDSIIGWHVNECHRASTTTGMGLYIENNNSCCSAAVYFGLEAPLAKKKKTWLINGSNVCM